MVLILIMMVMVILLVLAMAFRSPHMKWSRKLENAGEEQVKKIVDVVVSEVKEGNDLEDQTAIINRAMKRVSFVSQALCLNSLDSLSLYICILFYDCRWFLVKGKSDTRYECKENEVDGYGKDHYE